MHRLDLQKIAGPPKKTTHSRKVNTMNPYPLSAQRHDRAGIRCARAAESPTVRITIAKPPRIALTLRRAWMREWIGTIK
jgi:hypothetical protein